MKRHWGWISLSIGALWIAAGCQSGTSGAVALAPGAVPAPGATSAPSARPGTGRLRFVMTLPARNANQTRRGPRFVDAANTTSVVVSIDGSALPPLNIGGAACSTQSGTETCATDAVLKVGTHTLVVVTYDQSSGQGNQLSRASQNVTIGAGQSTTVTMTLSGILASMTIGFTSTSIPQGVATTVPVIVTAFDGDGAAIIGSYVNQAGTPLSIVLSDSDQTGHTSISPGSITSSSQSVNLTYDGTRGLGTISVGAAGNGVTAPQAVLAFATATPTATPSPSPVPTLLTTYSVAAFSDPMAVTLGPDNNVWFTEYNANKVGKITTSGSITLYTVPTGGSSPMGIAPGPDGNLWFCEFAGNNIAKVTTAGVFTEYAIPTGGSLPSRIVAGPDGNLWFTESTVRKIGKVTTAGVFTEYTLPVPGSNPQGITVGADGNLWVAEVANHKMAKLTTSGVITEYAVPSNNQLSADVALGPDGDVWFSETFANQVGKVTTAGTITEYLIPTANTQPAGMVAGPNGNLWFGETNVSQIGEVTTNGVFNTFSSPGINDPYGFTVGADSNLWIADPGGPAIDVFRP